MSMLYGEDPSCKNLTLQQLYRPLTNCVIISRRKNIKKNGFALNAQLGEGVILVFQGKDKKGRAARLLLSNPKNKDGEASENITLTLAYIEKPEDPDVFKIEDGDF